jgi:hypothetical protein
MRGRFEKRGCQAVGGALTDRRGDLDVWSIESSRGSKLTSLLCSEVDLRDNCRWKEKEVDGKSN